MAYTLFGLLYVLWLFNFFPTNPTGGKIFFFPLKFFLSLPRDASKRVI